VAEIQTPQSRVGSPVELAAVFGGEVAEIVVCRAAEQQLLRPHG